MNDEIWKPVVGYEGTYEVSNFGRVRSLDRLVGAGTKAKQRLAKGRLLRPGQGKGGYRHVNIWSNGRSLMRHVHVLVAEAFLGPRPLGCEIVHKNGDKRDCTDANLTYDSRGRNTRDRKWHGVVRKLTPAQAAEIKQGLRAGRSQRGLAVDFGVSKQTIYRIKKGDIHADVNSVSGLREFF